MVASGDCSIFKIRNFMIKELNELTWLVSENVTRAEEHLAFLCKNKSEVICLYRAVRDHRFHTDEEAIKTARIGERTSYKKYGRMLIEHLRQLVFFLSPPNAPYIRARNDGFRALSIMKLADFSSSKHAARQIALDLLDNGLKNERPEWVVEATRTLMDSIVTGEYNKINEFDRYADLFQEFKSYRDWEQKAKLYFDLIRLNYVRKKGYRIEIIQQIEEYVEELRPMASKIPSMTFNLCYYLLAYDRHFLTGNYGIALNVLENAIQHFQSRPYQANQVLLLFYYRKIMCYKQLDMYEEGVDAMQQSLKLSNEGTINWYAVLEIHYYLSMRMGHYEQALEIWKKATGHKRFSAQRKTIQEIWNIFGAYIFLTFQLTSIDESDKGLPRFRAAKFVNEVPVFSQDKNGLNVAVLIAHFLLHFVEGKKDEIGERVEALEKYRERYLRSEETRRSGNFIKILVAIARTDFQRLRYVPKVDPLLKNLKESNYDNSNQPYEMEIIPYLKLYELVRNFSPVSSH